MSNTTPKIDLSKLGYTAEEVATITALEQHAAELGMSHEAFARQHLTVSSTTWTRIRQGNYGGDRAAVCTKLAVALNQLRIELARRKRITGDKPFHWFPEQLAVMHAITAARTKGLSDPERLVLVEAPMGGGKTALAARIRVDHDALLLEASEAWRTDYRAVAAAIARAAGASPEAVDKRCSAAEVEQTMLHVLQARRRVLVIDEGEYFGPKTTNLLKLILNRTETVIVMFCIPALRARWMRAAQEEAAQLLRRAVVLDLGLVNPTSVAEFLRDLPIVEGALKTSCAAIARAANAFGGFSTVCRICQRLQDDELETITADDVAKAIAMVQHLQRQGGTK